MNKQELCVAISERTSETLKASGAMVDAFIAAVMEAVGRGERVQLIGFGTFEARERGPRKGHNPMTGLEIDIPGGKTPVFRAGKRFKNTLR